MNSIITPELLKIIFENYELNIKGRHGINHWARVRLNGLLISQKLQINSDVIEYFAVLHDSKRINEGKDFEHGKRSADFIYTLKDKYIFLNDEDFETLIQACIGHNSIKYSDNLLIQICWDSDRLDLLRAGINPNPKFMNTNIAKSEKFIQEANDRSINDFVPDIIDEWIKYITN
jgi:uncharacterized protein